ncbi:MAG: flagellin [Nitrospiraceae bacterium]|nr:flagellin [Nitrospiraceae bacterium]
MSLVINTNISSIDAQRNLWATGQDLNVTMQRLSSGLKINSAKDNAADYQIAEGMTAQINGLDQATNNTKNANSMVQTMMGAMNQIQSALQRMNELAVQASDASVSTSANFTSMNNEYTALMGEIDTISNQTKFNGLNVLNASASFTFQIGYEAGVTSQLAINTVNETSTTLGINASALTSQGSAQSAISLINTAITTISHDQGVLGAASNRLDTQAANLQNMSENTSAARSQIVDADFAAETAQMTRDMVLEQAGISVLSQANQQPQMVLKLLQ